jgi:uncharacterized protein YxeA
MKNKLLYILAITILILVGYFFIVRDNDGLSKNNRVQQTSNQPQEEIPSRPISSQELEELKKDPSAPDWLKEAESCNWVGEKIFCKLKGE